jgi:hypothetical protein
MIFHAFTVRLGSEKKQEAVNALFRQYRKFYNVVNPGALCYKRGGFDIE